MNKKLVAIVSVFMSVLSAQGIRIPVNRKAVGSTRQSNEANSNKSGAI